MIRLAGYEPGEDIEIAVTGTRPGERLHEILFAREEPRTEIGIDGVMAAKPVFADRDRVDGSPASQPPSRPATGWRPNGRSRRRSRSSSAGADAPACRASAASASRVELTGCQPRSFRAAGLATSDPASALIGLRASRRAPPAQDEGRNRDQPRPAAEPLRRAVTISGIEIGPDRPR